MRDIGLHHAAISADGTHIGFTGRGSGPGVVLVQGAMGTATDFDDLARALSPDFTVHTPDRRGRGMSPRTYEDDHDIARDVEDLQAVLAETGSSRVFGLSSGAVITLEAARTLPSVTHAAVYEPPFYATGVSHSGIARLGREIDRGDLPSALVTALLTSGTAPGPLRALPRPLARVLASVVLAVDSRRSRPGPSLRDLVPSVRYDFAVVGGVDGHGQRFAEITRPTLLLTGSRSPSFLKEAIRALHELIPQAELVDLKELDHSGPWNGTGRRGPNAVADALREFFPR